MNSSHTRLEVFAIIVGIVYCAAVIVWMCSRGP